MDLIQNTGYYYFQDILILKKESKILDTTVTITVMNILYYRDLDPRACAREILVSRR